MSVTADRLKEDIGKILSAPRVESTGLEVPKASDIAHCGGYRQLDATVLYADMADSTGLLDTVTVSVAAATIQSFLKMCARMIDHTKGTIAAFDGDRIMGIFVGPQKEEVALRCAFHINWGMQTLVAPMLRSHFGTAMPSSVTLGHGIGVDSGRLLAVRAGNRDAHDLVWVGRAANVAAKLSSLRFKEFPTVVTASTYVAASAAHGEGWSTSKWEAIKPSELHVCCRSLEV